MRSELAARLRRARELQAVTANRRDEAAARARRMNAHLEDCDGLLERAGELTNAAEEARRTLDARRAEVEAAHGKLVLVEEQRDAAGQMIDDAARQLRDLETSELDETTLRRELENARHALRDAEDEHAQANDAVRAIEQSAAARAGIRDHILHERAELVARIEAPMPDSWAVREALSAFDNETRVGEPDLVARDLAREWIEVDGEIERIESALPEAPSADEMAAAERRLDQIEQTIADLESADRRDALMPDARHEIEAAHEAVLAAEEDVDQSGGHEDDLARLHEAREIEHSVLRHHGYDTYLDVILAAPRPDGDAQADLLDALRARRVAEDTLAVAAGGHRAAGHRHDAADRAATASTARPPTCSGATRARTWPSCSTPTPWSRPAAPGTSRSVLAGLDILPAGVAVREAAVSWLVGQDQEMALRDECRRDVERLDRDLASLDDEHVRAGDESRRSLELVSSTHADVGATLHRVRMLEDELSDRASQDERRLQRIAAAEQLRSQIAAVSEALAALRGRVQLVARRRRGRGGRRRGQRRAGDSRAVRRRAPPAPHLRGAAPGAAPRAGDDPLGELPRLRETLAAEVERAEVALAGATEDLERARRDIDDTQEQLDDHLTVVPTDDIGDDDRRRALLELVGAGDVPAVLDDPISGHPDERDALLDQLTLASEKRPIVLLTDDPDILGWAISLPDDIGAVTRLAADTGALPTVAQRRRPPQARSGHLISPRNRTVPRRIPIRTKLAAALAVPICALLLVSVLEVRQSAASARETKSQTELATASIGPGGIITTLQNERNYGSVWLLGFEATLQLPVTSFEEAAAATDEAIASFREDLADKPQSVEDTYAPALDHIETQLQEQRPVVETYTGPRNLTDAQPVSDPFFGAYTELIDELFRANGQAALAIDDPTLRRGVELTDLASHQIENVARLTRVLLLAGVAGGLTEPPDVAEAAGLLGQVETGVDQVRQLGTGRYQPAAAKVDEEFSGSGYTELAGSAIETGTVQVADTMASLSREDDEGYNGFRNTVNGEIEDRADELLDESAATQRRYLALGVLALVVAGIVTWLVSRSITKPLRSLTQQAKSMAEDRLPAAVTDILETPLGDDVTVPTVEPVRVNTRDEVSDVADALNTVQDSALDLAVEQAVLRRNIADSFVNLGRRNQNLLGRQLDFITELESNETNPDTLANLFRLDHLATRMRRNAESLLVLAGIEPPRQWAAPVRLTDVIRAALGEVEDYQRVTVRGVEPATIIGSAAADLAHLLAELIENALVFSPPDQTVDIRGRNRPGGTVTTRIAPGYTLAIIDSGLGMPAGDIVAANRRLAGAESFTVAPSKYLGPLRGRQPRRPPRHPGHARQLARATASRPPSTCRRPCSRATASWPPSRPRRGARRSASTPSFARCPRCRSVRRVGRGGACRRAARARVRRLQPRRAGPVRCPARGAPGRRRPPTRRRRPAPPAAWSSGRVASPTTGSGRRCPTASCWPACRASPATCRGRRHRSRRHPRCPPAPAARAGRPGHQPVDAAGPARAPRHEPLVAGSARPRAACRGSRRRRPPAAAEPRRQRPRPGVAGPGRPGAGRRRGRGDGERPGPPRAGRAAARDPAAEPPPPARPPIGPARRLSSRRSRRRDRSHPGEREHQWPHERAGERARPRSRPGRRRGQR